MKQCSVGLNMWGLALRPFLHHYKLCDFGWVSRLLQVLVKSLVGQLCSTLCHHKDCSPPGSSVDLILQIRILECNVKVISLQLVKINGEKKQQRKTKKEYWSGCHSLLQRIFWLRDWTRVSRIAGRFFTSDPPMCMNNNSNNTLCPKRAIENTRGRSI